MSGSSATEKHEPSVVGIGASAGGLALKVFIFEDRDVSPTSLGSLDGSDGIASSLARIAELEAELAESRRRTHSVVEQYEINREEMTASGEEMQSTNEELRSTLEELETSREELQSINEEPQTASQQNRHKVEELAQLSGDLHNLLASTDIATLFLDRNLRIMRYTPELARLFNIRITDRGRPIADLTHRLGYPDLRTDAEAVLSRLDALEREIQDENGVWYLTRVLPYRTSDDRVEGVVINFIDIDARKKAEQKASAAAERLNKMVNLEVVLIFNESGTLIDGNEAFQRMSGYSKAEIWSGTLSWRTMTPPEYLETSEQQMARPNEIGRISPSEKEFLHKDGSRSWMMFAGASLGDGTVIEYCIDVSDRKRAEPETFEAKNYAESIIESIFVPFKRLNTWPQPGTGLAMFRRIVERHHGQLTVESVYGQSSTFRFTMPDQVVKP